MPVALSLPPLHAKRTFSVITFKRPWPLSALPFGAVRQTIRFTNCNGPGFPLFRFPQVSGPIPELFDHRIIRASGVGVHRKTPEHKRENKNPVTQNLRIVFFLLCSQNILAVFII